MAIILRLPGERVAPSSPEVGTECLVTLIPNSRHFSSSQLHPHQPGRRQELKFINFLSEDTIVDHSTVKLPSTTPSSPSGIAHLTS
jgi:hypothetical protein